MSKNRSESADMFSKYLEDKFRITVSSTTLLRALSHRSVEVGSEGLQSNEVLELLGDAVLDLVAAESLISRYPNEREGRITEIRSYLVCKESLAKAARNIGLGGYLVFGPSAQHSGLEESDSVLSDAFEAVVAAIYVGVGLDACKSFLRETLFEDLDLAYEQSRSQNPKNDLKEYLESNGDPLPIYEVESTEGPEHVRVFRCSVTIGSVKYYGEGATIKKAEQRAAAEALKVIV